MNYNANCTVFNYYPGITVLFLMTPFVGVQVLSFNKTISHFVLANVSLKEMNTSYLSC